MPGDVECLSSCVRELSDNTDNCPCQTNCPNGCPCINYECPPSDPADLSLLILYGYNDGPKPSFTIDKVQEKKCFEKISAFFSKTRTISMRQQTSSMERTQLHTKVVR